MKVTPLTLLRIENFPKDVQKWIPELIGPLNSFLTVATTALQNQLDFTNNFLGQTQNISFTWNGTPSLPKFKVTMSGTPIQLAVCSATENKNPVILLVAWQYINGSLNITDIAKVVSGVTSSLVTGSNYTLTVRIET